MLRTESGAIREWVEHLGIGIGAFFERAVGLLQRLDWAREEMVFPVFGRLRAERVFRQFHVSAWDAGLIQKSRRNAPFALLQPARQSPQ